MACLRRVECPDGTPRAVPDDLLAGVYWAWAAARADVSAGWADRTAPADLFLD